MKDEGIRGMNKSLLLREVYSLCFTERESLEVLSSPLALARKSFFENGRTAKVNKADLSKGFEGKLKGKVSKRGITWKRLSRGIATEEAYSIKSGPVVIMRGYNNSVTHKIYFNHDQHWIKTEYFDAGNTHLAKIILKPSDSFDAVERFDYSPDDQIYNSQMLYPTPFAMGSAEQSILNSRFGESPVILSTKEGMFAYSPEAQARSIREALADISEGTIVLMPAWEVREGELAPDSAPEDEGISFTSLEEYATVTPDSFEDEVVETEKIDTIFPVDAESSAGLENIPAEDYDADFEENVKIETADADDKTAALSSDDILAAAKRAAEANEQAHIINGESTLDDEPEVEETAVLETDIDVIEENSDDSIETVVIEDNESSEASYGNAEDNNAECDVPELEKFSGADAETANLQGAGYQSSVVNGQLSGHGRTEQSTGFTAYDGEYKDGKRHGFGAYYYKDGKLCYAGNWKDDQKDGLGVSFRNADGALHIANWQNNAPGGFVSLFDTDGNLRYGGKIIDGKKQGAGVSYNSENGTIFIGKWKDNEATGQGSVFDSQGNLLYTGLWQDGKRNGTGTEFDENGEIVFSGEWKDDKHYNGILYKKPSLDVADSTLNDTDITEKKD